jgi:hypothetical protein
MASEVRYQIPCEVLLLTASTKQYSYLNSLGCGIYNEVMILEVKYVSTIK